METLEQLKEIIKNAPEDATHVNTITPKELDIINYINANNFTWWHGSTDEWRSFGGMIDITFRSLSDIKDKIDLLESNQKLLDKTNQFDKAITDIGKHIQKSEPSFCMGGVDIGDSQARIIGYIEKLEVDKHAGLI